MTSSHGCSRGLRNICSSVLIRSGQAEPFALVEVEYDRGFADEAVIDALRLIGLIGLREVSLDDIAFAGGKQGREIGEFGRV